MAGAVPKEIREVPRPKSTVVKNHFGVFKVEKRTSIRVNGKVKSVSLGIVGEILDGQYIPYGNPKLKDPVEAREEAKRKALGQEEKGKPGRPAKSLEPHPADILSYGNEVLLHNLNKDLLADLYGYFDPNDAKRLYVIALLRTITPKLTEHSISWEYVASYINQLVPGLHLSKSVIPALLSDIGSGYTRIRAFMSDRVKRLGEEGTIAIDGMLKSYESNTSVYSAYSYKSRIK